jgi:hypothetical protein
MFLLVFLVVVACGLVGIIGASRLYHRVAASTADLRVAASRYLDAVRAGDTDRAYQQLCSVARSRTSLDVFRSQTKALGSYRLLSVQITTQNRETRGYVLTRLALTDGTTSDQTIPFQYEGGQWRPCDP